MIQSFVTFLNVMNTTYVTLAYVRSRGLRLAQLGFTTNRLDKGGTQGRKIPPAKFIAKELRFLRAGYRESGQGMRSVVALCSRRKGRKKGCTQRSGPAQGKPMT